MKLNLITTAFMVLIISPSGLVKAETTDIKACLNSIQVYWLINSAANYTGQTRTETPCQLDMTLSTKSLLVQASGTPLAVGFEFGPSAGEITRTLQSCRVDKEKLHIVFEEKISSDFEKRNRVQMTLLKRHGKGISLILSKRENKILRPLQQSSLICHLN